MSDAPLPFPEPPRSTRRVQVLLVAALLLFGGFLAWVGVFGPAKDALRSSWAYEEGVARARSSAAVREILGQPIEVGRVASGSVRTSGETGDAELVIPIRGPEGEGRLHVVARKRYNNWSFERLELVPARKAVRIDLLSDEGGAGTPSPARPG